MVLEATDGRMDRLQLTTLCGLSRLAALGRLADNRQIAPAALAMRDDSGQGRPGTRVENLAAEMLFVESP